jgi:SAM-dependent methyltransferase
MVMARRSATDCDAAPARRRGGGVRVTARLADAYFDALYATSHDPWQLSSRRYEERKYAITLSMLPRPRYRHAFEPGCSIGTLTERLAVRCDAITATDVAAAALDHADRRLRAAGRREQVNLMRHSLDEPWPKGDFDLVVFSEVGYHLHAETLRSVLDREHSRLNGATVVAAHWRHPVEDYPMSGDHTNQIIAATPDYSGSAATATPTWRSRNSPGRTGCVQQRGLALSSKY